MTDTTRIKKFLLRALLAANGMPMPGTALDIAVKDTLVPRPLMSNVELAKEELQTGGYIIGTADELDSSVSWALTIKGELRAKQLA